MQRTMDLLYYPNKRRLKKAHLQSRLSQTLKATSKLA